MPLRRRWTAAWVYSLTLSGLNALIVFGSMYEMYGSTDGQAGFAVLSPVIIWPLALVAYLVLEILPAQAPPRNSS